MTAAADIDSRTTMLRAAAWMMGSVASFLCMAVAGRAVADSYDTFEIMTYRSFVGLFTISLVLTLQRRWHVVTSARMPLQVARHAAHFAGQNLWFYAIAVIPLAQVFAIEFTGPIWVLILSPLLLGEKMTRNRVFATLAGFAGILMVTRPGFEMVNSGIIAMAVAAIFFGATAIMTKKLTQTQATLNIMLWLTVTQSVFGLVCAGWDGQITLPTAEHAPWLLAIGLLGLSAHFCLTSALALAPASSVMPLDFMRLPLAALVGMALYSEPLDPWVLVGAAVIFFANYLNIRYETRA